ncbi:type II toxin-antitoxin system PemK/MazF family toxin [Natronobacterium texcoconense]|uniref:PemK-like, MazF-like toxin of type II toxin-antitoxin system n=1 Tax=Natronobacterium texcoconense TaxID=1095778 RepID=A0A1H0ZY35_NATTX|nr:type II toxin-antitoxin system PemK/MazF family toxin [Natronobacterium texcoconense]SDQ32299.1 PemK-like, MazF-like toxin of type II toxin-antitoxin system [Natronobacterium texcoconense]
MTDIQGEVWWGPAPHKSDGAYRPWLVVSDSSHPFSADECIVVAMTTQNHPDGIPVPDEAWTRGGSNKEAYVSPWYVTTIKHRDLDNQQGELADALVAEAIEALHGYTSL